MKFLQGGRKVHKVYITPYHLVNQVSKRDFTLKGQNSELKQASLVPAPKEPSLNRSIFVLFSGWGWWL